MLNGKYRLDITMLSASLQVSLFVLHVGVAGFESAGTC